MSSHCLVLFPGICAGSWLLQPAEPCGSDAMGLLRLGHKRPCSLWLICWNICFWNLYAQRDWIILRQPCHEKAQATGRAIFGLTIPANSSLQDIFHPRHQASEWRNHLGNGPTRPRSSSLLTSCCRDKRFLPCPWWIPDAEFLSIIKWRWFDTAKFRVIYYTVADYQKSNLERPELSFDYYFLFWSIEEMYGWVK